MNVTKGVQVMKNRRGFTLMEMLIVVAIIAILAAIAAPAYFRYVERSRRVEGQVLANTVAQAQERHFATYNRYANNLVGAGINRLGFSAAPCGVVASETCKYSAVVATTNNNQNFTVTVTPRLIQAADKCGSLTLTGTGVKAFTGPGTNGKCW